MFGMLRPARATLSYRTTYARCCQHHRRVAGLSALPFLSYEAVLLYQTAVDAGRVRLDDLPAVRCCKLRPLPARTDCADREAGTFCAHVGLLLASIKVSDDRRDGASLRSRLFGYFYKRRFRAAYRYFTRLDPAFEQRVEGFIAAHLALERPGAEVPLAEYVRPTARAFGYVFSLMSRLEGLSAYADLLRDLGEAVGAAIIAYDCAVDWWRDARRGEFNPLPDGDVSVQTALQCSSDCLARARDRCRVMFGPEPLTVQTLQGVIDRVAGVGRRLACPQCGEEVRRTLEGWGLTPGRGALQLRSVVGLGGLAALLLGLAGKLLASSPSPVTPGPPGAVPPATPEVPVVKPPRPKSGGSGDCGSTVNGCDGCTCCCEGADCAVDNSCDFSGCGEGCNSCDACGNCNGCDFSC
jgi:hypothetical protein